VADDITWDFSELTKLAGDLGKVPNNAGPKIRAAVQYTATNVKKDARASVSEGKSSWSALPPAIDYDLHGTTGRNLGGISAEVGYNKGRGGGKLGNLREFGAPGKSLAPHNDLANALEKNQNDFQHGLEVALKDAEREAGL